MFLGKLTSSYAVVLLLRTALVLSGAASESEHNSSSCALQCEVPPGKTQTKCKLTTDPLKLNCSNEDYSSILRDVASLDLSNNSLTQVPSWMFPYCKNLTILSLAQNSIKTIKPGTFRDLTNLSSLNLSFNILREWRIDLNIELQSCISLDMTGNGHWIPNKHVLQLKNLTTVRGAKVSEYCENCSLVKIKANAAVTTAPEWWCYESYRSPSGWWWHDQIQYGKALDIIKAGFWPKCLCDDVCLTQQWELPHITAVGDVIIKASLVLYVTGSVALLVNVTVIFVIIFHESLKGDLAVCLILTIVVCDALIGLVSVLYTRLNYLTISIDFLYDKLEGHHYDVKSRIENLMNVMGPILTCAVASQVCGSFILTLEKVLKIVFAMRPEVRIETRSAIILSFLSWSLSVTFAVLPVFNVGRMTYSDLRHSLLPTPLATDQWIFSDEKNQVSIGIAAGTQVFLIIIQLISFVLYLPIFIVVKRSGANVGIKREATIAKKIALLIFTNLIFFAVPVVLGVFQHKIWVEFGHGIRSNWKDHTLAEYQWLLFTIFTLPVMCVSINSVLNPLLYALRHPKIKRQLKDNFSRCRSVLRERFVDVRQHLHCHSSGIEQSNDMEI